MMKSEAINKLAEIMNRKDMSKKESNRGNAMLLRKKDKECKKLQQELSRVSFTFLKVCAIHRIKALFHSSQKPTRKLAARTFIQSQYLKALAASLRVGFCDEWKRKTLYWWKWYPAKTGKTFSDRFKIQTYILAHFSHATQIFRVYQAFVIVVRNCSNIRHDAPPPPG